MQPAQSITDYIDALTNLCMQGHAAYARSHADAAFAAEPLRGHLGRAAVAAATRDLATLRAEVAAAEALVPRDSAVLQTQAVMHVLLGEPVAAVVAARAAAEVDPSPRSRSGLARVLLLVGRRDEGRAVLDALVADLDDADAHLQLAEETKDEQSDASLQHLVAAYLAAPADPRPMQALMQLARDSSWPIGVAVLARHIRVNTEHAGLKYVADLLGLAAVEYLRSAGLEPLVDTPPSVYAGAIEASRAVPVGARLTLAGLLIDQDRLADARALLASVAANIASNSDRAHYEFLEGRLAAANGDFDGAASRYRAALGFDPLNASAACNLVDLCVGGGTRAMLDEAGAVLARIPEVTRRMQPLVTYNEAAWLEARGEKSAALELVEFLRESPLGKLTNIVRAMRTRLVGPSA